MNEVLPSRCPQCNADLDQTAEMRFDEDGNDILVCSARGCIIDGPL
jgi:hypothetical protein